MVTASVKSRFADIYGATQFEGRLQTAPARSRGAWVCRIYVEGVAGATARLITFRLGHLDSLRAIQGTDYLLAAKNEGWDGRLVSDRHEVVLWTARERAQRVTDEAARRFGTAKYQAPSSTPRDRDWRSLEQHLGEAPSQADRTLFEEEYRAVIEGRSSPKMWEE